MGSRSAVANVKTIPIPWVDFVRFVSAFLVVLAHVADLVYLPWFWGAFYYSLSRVAVPIFFLASGYLLLSKQEELLMFLQKRLVKVVLPFLVWSVIYEIQQNHPFQDSRVTFQSLIRIFVRILQSPRDDHLWFFYALIGLYLVTPVLRVFVSKASNSEILYLIGLWFFAKPVLLLVEAYTPIRNGFDLFYVGGYIGYFVLGFYLGKLGVDTRLWWAAFIVFILGFVVTFAVFYFDIPPVDNELVLRDYLSLNIVIMSLGAFIILKNVGERMLPSFAQVSILSAPIIFGIYLIHPLFLDWMIDMRLIFGFDPFTLNAFFIAPIITLIAFVICWLIVYLATKVPVLRSIF
jgi:surface polysaccharide O-acyltransferase-like enzyme